MTTRMHNEEIELRRLLSFATPFIYGGLCYFAAAIPFLFDGVVAVIMTVLAFIACALGTAALAVFSVGKNATRLKQFAVTTTPTLLAAGSFLFLLLVDSSGIRFVAVTGCMLLIAAFHGRIDSADEQAFAHLSRAVRAVALFFLLAFSFGIARFIHVPLPLMVIVAGLGLGFSAQQDLRGAAEGRLAIVFSAVTGLLGAELYLGLALLPTSFMTNAAVLLIGMELISTAMRGVFLPVGGHLLPRGHVLASGLLAAALLGTSAWF